jgi:SOS-response transcriptional repressor LexA
MRAERTSGHLWTACTVQPIAWAALLVEPPNMAMASVLVMLLIQQLNHSSCKKATIVQIIGYTIATMVDYSERLKLAMKQSGHTTQMLADALGISYQAAKKAVDGKTKAFTASNNQKAANLLGVAAEWLATGENGQFVLDKSNVSAAQLGSKQIPLLSYVSAGTWTGAVDAFQPNDAHDWLVTDLELSEGAFALEIKGDSMQPEFKPGDRVIIDPDISPQPGDFVVAKNGEDEALFKKYRPRSMDPSGNVIFELVPLNDDYPTMRSDAVPIRIVGTMVEHRKYRRR